MDHQAKILNLVEVYLRENKISKVEGLSIMSLVGSKLIASLVKTLADDKKEVAIDAFLNQVRECVLDYSNSNESTSLY